MKLLCYGFILEEKTRVEEMECCCFLKIGKNRILDLDAEGGRGGSPSGDLDVSLV